MPAGPLRDLSAACCVRCASSAAGTADAGTGRLHPDPVRDLPQSPQHCSGWSNRLIEAMRAFNGQYSPTKMQEVMKFGGSQIYARLTAQKCRAASSLLRDIYLGTTVPGRSGHRLTPTFRTISCRRSTR